MTAARGRTGHVENIGPRGARRRLIGGAVWLVVAVAGSAWAIAERAPAAAYVALAIPYFLAAVGWLQARERT